MYICNIYTKHKTQNTLHHKLKKIERQGNCSLFFSFHPHFLIHTLCSYTGFLFVFTS